MKILTRVLLALIAVVWWAAAPAASVIAGDGDFLWSDLTGGSGGGGSPDETDTCTIASGREITCDANSTPCTCGRINLTGTLIIDRGSTLVVGPGATGGAIGASLDNSGTFINNGTIEIACAATDQANCEIDLRAGSEFLLHGEKVGQGSVVEVVAEPCPEGYFDPAVDTDSNGPEECDDADNDSDGYIDNDIRIRVSLNVNEDEYNDMRLYFPSLPSGNPGHPGRYYTIADTQPPNLLVLDGDARGHLFPHGVVLDGCSAEGMDTTSVTLSSCSLSADMQDALVGGWLICDADCPSTELADASWGSGNTYDMHLPCADAARITDITSATAVTIESAYSGAGCDTASAGAATLIGETGNIWPYVDEVQRIRTGDFFVLDDPATLTIPDGNRGLRLSYVTSGNTSQDQHFYINRRDDAVFSAKHADIRYCGIQDDDTTDRSCFTDASTSSNSDGDMTFEFTEFAFTAGSALVTWENLPGGTKLKYVTTRDSAYSDSAEAGDNHQFKFSANDSHTGADFTAIGVSGIRIGDDLFYDGPNTIGDDDWDDITLKNIVCNWLPNNTPEGTTECFQFNSSDGRGITGTLWIDRAVTSGNERDLHLAWNGGNVLVTNSVFVNLEGGLGGPSDNTGSSTFSGRPTSIVNVVGMNMGYGSNIAYQIVGRAYSSYFQPMLSATNDWTQLGSFYQTVLDGSGTTQNNIQHYDPGTTTTGKYESGGPVLKDLVLLSGSSGTDGMDQRSGITINSSHITWIQKDIDNSVDAKWTRTLSGGGGTITVNDSIFFGLLSIVDAALGQPTTYNVDGNLYVGTANDCTSNCTGCCGSNNVATGNLGITNARNPLVTVQSAGRSVTTTDGSAYPGARCAGPTNWPLLERLHPAVAELRRPGVVDTALCADADGDGIWDIEDNCDTLYNPLQAAADDCE